MDKDIVNVIFEGWIVYVPFLLALCFHEFSHGYVANKMGDPTAKLMGRLTMNPIVHADMIGTVILPLAAIFMGMPFFGWAKPVPVNSKNLKVKNERVGMFWVALAGPASNVLLAFVGAILFGAAVHFLGPEFFMKAREPMSVFLMINFSLALFNLIPIHPLDGGKIWTVFLSEKANRKMEELSGILGILLFVLFLTGGLGAVLFKPVLIAADFTMRFGVNIFGFGA